MQELGKQTNIDDDSSYSLDVVSSPRVGSCSPTTIRSLHSPKNLESHSIAFDKNTDVYGGYMLHKLGSPDKDRKRGVISSIFTESKTHQELTTPENKQRLISEHRQKQRSDNWRVGRLFTQSEGIYQMSTMWYRSYFALIILGILQGVTTWIISNIVGVCWDIQGLVVDDTSISVVAQAMFVGILKIFFITLSVLVTWTFAPNAAGSGIPELRAILGGIHIKGYLSVKTLVVKIIGLGLALGSGLPLGLEGPFIHVSAILARQFTQIKLFAHLDRKQLLIAACAGGLSACFASPIGGVLFSIEVTLTYFEVTSYWTTFCCAAVASCMTSILQPKNLIPFETRFDSDSWSKSEIPLFIVVGLCGGLIGCAFTRYHEIVVYLRRRYQKKTFGSNPFAISAFVALMFTIVSFSLQVTRHPARSVIPELFKNNIHSLRADDESNWNSGVGMYGNLILFIVINFIFTGLTITLNIPCGVFAPTFTIGAALGRLMGEFFQDATSAEAPFDVNNPAVYAVVGAAAFTSGVTKTISPAVIAMELTHDAQLAMPILLAVTVACGVCSQLYYSFYDSTLQLKNIPLLPFSPSEPMNKSYSPPRPYEAIDVMEAEFQYLSTTPSQAQVIKLLEMSDHDWYPIVHSNRDMVLVGEVARDTLVDFISSFNELELNSPASNPQRKKRENAEEEKSIMCTRFMNQLNLSPIQVVAEMSLIKVYTLFHVLKPENIYVTKYARLIGVIHENDLLTRELGIQLKKRHFLHRLWNFVHSLVCKYRRVAV